MSGHPFPHGIPGIPYLKEEEKEKEVWVQDDFLLFTPISLSEINLDRGRVNALKDP